MKKLALQGEAYGDSCGDPLYILDAKLGAYVPFGLRERDLLAEMRFKL